ncbi:hypothetical protein BGZ47_004799, partial [Haplosporangium gracile]
MLKPWKSPPEPPLVSSTNTSPPKTTPKNKQRNVATMDKKELVNAMQWDHPTRTLDIGTINANATRALNKGMSQANASAYLSAIKRSLRDVTRISSRIKRTAQRAIGQYIERLSANNIDENDDNNNSATNITTTTNTTSNATNTTSNATNTTTNTANSTINTASSTNTKILSKINRRLLDILCPAFSDKDLAASSKEETTQEPDGPEGLEEHDNSLDKKNEA